MKNLFPLTFLSLLLFSTAGFAQTTWHVPDDFATIQLGIDGATNGDTVIVRDGTYVENINFNGKAITLKSENGPATTIIDGNQAGTVVTFVSGEGSNSALEGFTVTNGKNNYGGGIHVDTAYPTIKNCIVTMNASTDDGGGMWVEDGDPVVENCTFSNNVTINDGGGMWCSGIASPTLTNCAFADNSSGSAGGGMACRSSSSPTLTDCTFTNNTAKYGGGMRCWEGTSSTLQNCTFTGNTADYGGGVEVHSSSLALDNCTFKNNSANYGGGGIHCGSQSEPTISGNLIENNNSGNYGGGIGCSGATPIIRDNTIIDNESLHGGGIYIWGYSGGSGDQILIEGNVISGNFANIALSANGNWAPGGGIYIGAVSPSIINNLIYSNIALNGGAIFAYGASPSIVQCTMTDNFALDGGDSIYQESGGYISGSNCIIYHNNQNTYVLLSGSLFTYSDIQHVVGQSWGGVGCFSSDPGFVSVANKDFRLSHIGAGQAFDSPCIDTGDPLAAVFGTTRTDFVPDSGVIDMGYHYFAPPNFPPLAVDDIASLTQDEVVQVDVLLNDSDPEGDPLTVISTTAPANGTAAIVANQVEYTPNPGWLGVDLFDYEIEDTFGNRDTATVTVTVNETIRLTVDPIYSGGTATFHIDNCEPKSWFYLCWSLAGPGPTTVGNPNSGVYFDLLLSQPIGATDPFRLNSIGSKQFGPIPVPVHIVAGTPVWFQGIALDVTGGTGITLTNMVPITLQ